MATGSFRFDRFHLDLADRQLRCEDGPVALNARYLDALALLVREHGRLVTKDRFHEEVWRGAPVTDEALTQCIRTLRRQLGDDAASPRFIRTEPKHGYRFIAPVEPVESSAPSSAARARPAGLDLGLPVAGAAGGAAAGVFGGLFYGSLAAAQASAAGMGGASVLLVLLAINIVLGALGGGAVALGMAASDLAPKLGAWRRILGAALGGLLVGAIVRLVGLDAFDLLFGRAPAGMTGAAEGLALGAACGLAVWIGGRAPPARRLFRAVLAAVVVGAGVGVLIAACGGRLMGGSLDLLAQSFPNSRLRLGDVGRPLGEADFGPVTQALTAAIEGLVFTACLAAAVMWRERRARAPRVRSAA